MNRREYLTGLAGVGALGATGSATADNAQFLRASSAVGDDTHHPGPPRFTEVGVPFYDYHMLTSFGSRHADGKDSDNFAPRIVGDPQQDPDNYSGDDFSWSIKSAPEDSSAELEYAPPIEGTPQYDSGAHNAAEFAPDVPGLYVLELDAPDATHEQTIRVFPEESTDGAQPRIELTGRFENGEFVVGSNAQLAPNSDQSASDLIVEWLADDRDALSTEDIRVGEGTDSHTARIPKDALGGETCRVHAAPYDGANHGSTDTVHLDPEAETVEYPNRPPEWMENGIMYEIFPRSFEGPPEPGEWPLTNSNANFANMEERVDYLDSLNVDVLWFTPIFPGESSNWTAQNADEWSGGGNNRFKYVGGGPHGYDALSYFEIAEDLGSGVAFSEYEDEPWPWEDGYDPANNRREDARQNAMAEFQSFVEACHEKDIKICLDFVINHSGRHHPFFQDTVASKGDLPDGLTYRSVTYNRDSKYFDWFDRKDQAFEFNGQVVDPNPAPTNFAGFRIQPQWNFANVALREHILAAAAHWADMGIDAFRCDVAYGAPHSIWKEVREVVRSRNSEFMLLDETIPNDPTYAENEFDMHFDTSDFMGTATSVASGDQSMQSLYDAVDVRDDEGFPEYTLITNATENHDEFRLLGEAIDGSRENPEKAQRAVWAAGVALPGVPFIYYGQERQISKFGDARLGFGYRQSPDILLENIDSTSHQVTVEVTFDDGTASVSESGTVAADDRIRFTDALPASADPESASVTVSVDGEPIGRQPSYEALDNRSGIIRSADSVLFRGYAGDFRGGYGDVGEDSGVGDPNMSRAFMNWDETPEDHLQFYRDVTALYKETPQLKPRADVQRVSFQSDSDVLVFGRAPESDDQNPVVVAVNADPGTAQVDLPPAGGDIDGTADLFSGEDIGVDGSSDNTRTIEVDTIAVVETGSLISIGQEIARFDEQTGDDNGPGSYTYPTGEKYADGAFDIAEATAHTLGSDYQFRFLIDGPLENPDGTQTGVSVQHFQVYLSNPDASDGATAGRAGTNVDLASQYQYRVVGHPENGVIVEDHEGSEVATGSLVANPSEGAVILQFPQSAFDVSLENMTVAPLLFGYDPSAQGGVVQVESEAGTNTFGGADNDNAPNVIDAVVPTSTTQGDALSYSGDARAAVPLTSVSAPFETVAEFTDPAGDNKGPGSYQLPTGDSYYDEMCDLRGLTISESRSRTRFAFEMERVDNEAAFGLPRGWSHAFFQVYIRDPEVDPDNVTGNVVPSSTQGRTGLNAEFEAAYQYRLAVNGEQAKQVENGNGDAVSSDVNATVEGNTIVIDVPSGAVGGSLEGKEIAPLVCPFDGFGGGQLRPIGSSPDTNQIGAPNPGNAPKVLDMITPSGVDQGQALSYSDDSVASIPYTSFSEGAVGSGDQSSTDDESGTSDGSGSDGEMESPTTTASPDGSGSDGEMEMPTRTAAPEDNSDGGTTTAADDGPGFGTVSGLLGTAGGAAYAARQLLGEGDAADAEDTGSDAESAEDDLPADD